MLQCSGSTLWHSPEPQGLGSHPSPPTPPHASLISPSAWRLADPKSSGSRDSFFIAEKGFEVRVLRPSSRRRPLRPESPNVSLREGARPRLRGKQEASLAAEVGTSVSLCPPPCPEELLSSSAREDTGARS